MREFRRQLDEGMWAAVPVDRPGTGRREALLVTDFDARSPPTPSGSSSGPAPRAARRLAPRLAGARRDRRGVVLFAVVLGALVVLLATSSRPASRAGVPGRRPQRCPGSASRRSAAERAEQRSLELLRSVINPEEWDMFTDLGFICVTGKRGRRAQPGAASRSPATAT